MWSRPGARSVLDMTSQPRNTPKRKLGLPLWGIFGLALLAAPRVVLHDLHLIEEGTLLNALLVFIPPTIWVGVAVLMHVRRPFLTLLTVGTFYGVVLAAGHLLFWDQAFPDGSPQLGGNLADTDPLIQGLVFRGFTVISSLVTGTLVGAVCGLISAGISAVLRR